MGDAPSPTFSPDTLARVTGEQGLERLRAIMAALRDPDHGCPWDVQQNFASIAPYTIEEAHEVADSIARDDMAALCDELGDLMLQVVYHARMAEERRAFALDDVIDAICAKMIRRHPHVFGDGAPSPGWEQIKADERSGAGSIDDSAMAGVALGLPGLMRAAKLQKRAARVGFDWPDSSGPRSKILEEIAEVDAATSSDEQADEIGDLLFSVVNWSRHLGIDPEAAMRAANAKFERRFRAMEQVAGDGFAGQDIDTLEHLWRQAKMADG
jgi:ATP diphosphatase